MTIYLRFLLHLKKIVLTGPTIGGSAFNLSPCGKLEEIYARFDFADFAFLIANLRTVSSHKFRKLTILLTSNVPKIKRDAWVKLGKEVSALAKRVGATGNNKLEVAVYYSGGTLLSKIEQVSPLISPDARVSLQTEDLPPSFVHD